MFTQIKTSAKNKDRVALLTRKLGLGTENIIARIALSYSLSLGEKYGLDQMQDAGGKEYSKNVLLGPYIDYYIALVAIHYQLHISDKDIPKYIKLHVDYGLEIIEEELNNNPNLDGFDFLTDKVKESISQLEIF